MKFKFTLILWGLLQLALGCGLYQWSKSTNLNDYLFWIGMLNLVIWFFIGQVSSILVKNQKFDGMIIANLFANVVGIVAFAIYYFGIFKDSVLHTYSVRYYEPMIRLTSNLMDQDTISQMFQMDKVLLVALLLQMLVFGIGYLMGKKN